MRSGSTLSAVEKRAFGFAENVRKQATAIVDAAFAQVVFEDNKDPKLYGSRSFVGRSPISKGR
jgi:hypothetical protein